MTSVLRLGSNTLTVEHALGSGLATVKWRLVWDDLFSRHLKILPANVILKWFLVWGEALPLRLAGESGCWPSRGRHSRQGLKDACFPSCCWRPLWCLDHPPELQTNQSHAAWVPHLGCLRAREWLGQREKQSCSSLGCPSLETRQYAASPEVLKPQVSLTSSTET